MTAGIKTVLYPVTDIAAARALYGALLGIEPSMDKPYYVQFDVDDQAIGLDPNGHKKGMTGPVGYYEVTDIRAAVERLVAGGAVERQPINEVGGGRLIATLADPDGNLIGLPQP